MSDETPQVPARRDRREAVREKAALVQAQQRRNRAIRTSIVSVVVVAIVAAAGIAVAWTLISRANQPELQPAGLDGDAIVVESVPASVLASFSGSAGAGTADGATPAPSAEPSATPGETQPSETPAATSSVVIDVYLDYMSADSSTFQSANAAQLSGWVSQGSATIAYHPVALLTAKSNGTKYSLRAAAAAACVATHEPESFFQFNHELLAQRPEIDTDGLSDNQLAALAIAANATNPKIVRGCIERQDFLAWVQQATARALQEPVGETDEPLSGPMVLVNGQRYLGALDDPKEFAQFVLTLSSDAYFTTPSPSPSSATTSSPTPSATPTP